MNKSRKDYQQALIEQKMTWRKAFFGVLPTCVISTVVGYCFLQLINFIEGRLIKELRTMYEFRKQETSGIMAGLKEVQEAIHTLKQTIQTLKPASTEINSAEINAEFTEPDPELDSAPCCGDTRACSR